VVYPPFEYGDHTADILIIANGSTLPEAFRNAALGVLNIMYDTGRVDKVEAVNVTVEGVDLEQLLFNWIDEVIYWFDGRKMAIGDIVINRFDEDGRIEACTAG
jgi:archease family protein